MAEQAFYSGGGVTVTNSRFIVPAETFAMSGITSVKSLKQTPSRKIPITLIVIGLIAMYARFTKVGLLFLAIGIVWWILDKPKYAVVLCSASGETEALTSKDGGFISQVINALNEAIVARG